MNFDALREAIASDNPGRARPALASLVEATPEQAEPLLLLGLQQSDMLLRQLSCSGLGHKPTPAGWEPLVHTLRHDPEVAVRAEAANALVSHGLQRAWPLLLEAFQREHEWLLRCSVLSAVAEHPEMAADQLLEIGRLAVADADGTVRVGGTEVLGRLAREGAPEASEVAEARALLAQLQHDSDHRVVGAALNGLQA
ncbi:HEAT repeat domain-containing protein [Synechococcus sp. LA31]|jgi:HEAT repeat protein|uniref:HEAT repeat domain-containing protein n=1 Tax=Synechococcus sp. LA31 TaxID=2741953 RepID=UPI001BDC2D31|nr:HEAT repeat domain-containing protein [Synechococcus sp. LA31]QVV66994.1 HEAT repeat domain-containing protein [Synechococcus sp. LA31]